MHEVTRYCTHYFHSYLPPQPNGSFIGADRIIKLHLGAARVAGLGSVRSIRESVTGCQNAQKSLVNLLKVSLYGCSYFKCAAQYRIAGSKELQDQRSLRLFIGSSSLLGRCIEKHITAAITGITHPQLSNNIDGIKVAGATIYVVAHSSGVKR
jgi:uncharacterized protein YfiM (DUF2279 family)